MKEARLLESNEIITADKITSGEYSVSDRFVDLNNNIELKYVSEGKNGRSAHFRIHTPKKRKPSNKRVPKWVFIESSNKSNWYDSWIETASIEGFEINKLIKSGSREMVIDAYCPETGSVIEFKDFNDPIVFIMRNFFIKDIVWLLNLSDQVFDHIRKDGYEILIFKDVFRLYDDSKAYKNHHIFIQIDEIIYEIRNLSRKIVKGENDYSVWKFELVHIINPKQFMELVYSRSVYDLWDKSYSFMIIQDIYSREMILIRCDPGHPNYMATISNNKYEFIRYQNVVFIRNGLYEMPSCSYHTLYDSEANERKWRLIWHSDN